MSRQLSQMLAPSWAPITTPAKVLHGATDRLRGGPQKWAKGDFHVDGGDCAYGAIEIAMSTNAMILDEFREMERALLHELKAMHPELTANNIADLNDDPVVTYEDVLAAFEKATLKFEEQA